MSFDRRALFRFIGKNGSWLAPCVMVAAITTSYLMRIFVGYSPPEFALLSVATLIAGLSGIVPGIVSAVLVCCYLTFLTIIGAGPPMMTSNFFQLGLTSTGILAVACGLGLSTERYRGLIENLERADAELKKSRDELETRIQEATRDLQLSEIRLKRAQRVGRMGSWERNLETGDVWWSDERFRLHGLSGETSPPSFEKFLEWIHPEDREVVENELLKVWSTGESSNFEFRVTTPDGVTRIIRSSAETETDVDGFTRVISGIAQDVTELRMANELIRQSEARLREAQRVAHIGSFERDLRSGESLWSDESFNIFAIEPSDTVPYSTFLERIHPDDRERVIGLAQTAIAMGNKFESQYRIVLPDGTERIIRAIGEVRYDEDGSPTKLTGTGQDVTERVELEREVIAISERERNRIGRDLHDGLGQELTGISLALQSLSRQLLRGDSLHVDSLQTVVAMVQNTISETRGFARQLAPVFLAEQGLSAALRSLADDINEHSTTACQAHSDFEEDIHNAEIATHLYRIAQEGISNAIKHGSARNIDLKYGRDGDSVYLEIVDDGTGLPTTGELTEGMGMRSMRFRAQMLRGQLDVVPRPEGGTRVRCSCPFPFH